MYLNSFSMCCSKAYHPEVVVVQQLAVVIQDREVIFNLLVVLGLLKLRVFRAQTQATLGVLYFDDLEAGDARSLLEVEHFHTHTYV